MKAQAVEVGAETRLGAAHAKVGRHRKAEARTHRSAMHRGDQGLGAAKEPHRLRVQRAGVARGAVVVPAVEVGAGAEGAPLGGQHDGAAAGLGVEPVEVVGQFAQQRRVHVVERTAADFEQRDVRVARVEGCDVAHWTSSLAMST
ncbi:hypothetical protein D3C85_1255050 [compost metagenome]